MQGIQKLLLAVIALALLMGLGVGILFYGFYLKTQAGPSILRRY